MVDLDVLLAETKDLPPCGPNLEHDPSFFELEEAARLKPEQQSFGKEVKAAEDRDWPKVVTLAQTLLLRTKDLRVAIQLTRGLARTDRVQGLATGLTLIHGLLERYWERVYPVLEADLGDDPTERLNALAPLTDPELIIKDLRDADLVNSREHGQLKAREVEIALGRLASPRAGGASKNLAEVHGQLAAAFASDRTVPSALRQARQRALAIQTLVTERVGAEQTIDLKPLIQPLESLLEACDVALGARDKATGSALAPDATDAVEHVAGRLIGDISTRDEALRVLDLVCAYLERREPTNPAPLFIRRAQRLMTKNFVEIVKDLIPDSLSNLEKLAGLEKEKK
jgi:type VI secretion system protein ImpA